jgi:hypothetical protein
MSHVFRTGEQTLTLSKIGIVPIEWSRDLPSAPSSVTVIRDASGRYFASFVVEVEPTPLPANGKAVGIDLGLASLAVTSAGEKIAPPKFLCSALKRLRRLQRLQRNLKHKQKGSNRLAAARRQMAKLHATIADKRLDFLHQLSTRIIRENQTVVLEDLNVSGDAQKQAAGPLDCRRRLAAVLHPAGIQGRAIWQANGGHQPMAAHQSGVLNLRTPGRQKRAVDSGMAVPELRSGSRPRHQSCSKHPRRRTGGESKRAWSRASVHRFGGSRL